MNNSSHESSIDSTELLAIASGIVQEGLMGAFKVHEALAERGLETVQKNQFGDVALRVDVEAEEAVLQALEPLHVRVFSEEHGTVDFNPDANLPALVGVLDGLDGSSLYKKERGTGRYGTMFALFEGDNPTYDAYLSAGVMQHSTGKLILATRGQGLKVIDVKTGEGSFAHTKDAQEIQPGQTVIFLDNLSMSENHQLHDYFRINETVFAKPLHELGFETLCLGASVAGYAAVATGEADIVGESTRKGNLEIAAAYGLIREAGGVMVTLDGEDIGAKQLLDFGQREHIPVLTASNPEVANRILHILTPH